MSLLAVSMVFAYQGNPDVQGPNFSEERHESMQEAFENLDYQAWHDLMAENDKKGHVLEIVNEDNFARFVEMHNAKIVGDIETTKEIAEELGLGLGRGQGKMNKHARGYERGFKQGFKSGNCPYADLE